MILKDFSLTERPMKDAFVSKALCGLGIEIKKASPFLNKKVHYIPHVALTQIG